MSETSDNREVVLDISDAADVCAPRLPTDDGLGCCRGIASVLAIYGILALLVLASSFFLHRLSHRF